MKKSSRSLFIIVLVFVALVAFVFLNQREYAIDWIEDYSRGIESAKQQNKPALLCFFKYGTRYNANLWNNFYNQRSVVNYVEANFIPILIDVEKCPEIAKRYNINYYPTHYIEHPASGYTDGPFVGNSRLSEFIERPRNFTK